RHQHRDVGVGERCLHERVDALFGLLDGRIDAEYCCLLIVHVSLLVVWLAYVALGNVQRAGGLCASSGATVISLVTRPAPAIFVALVSTDFFSSSERTGPLRVTCPP